MSNEDMEVAILTPVYDDWPSFAALLEEIGHIAKELERPFRVIAVDDGTSEKRRPELPELSEFVREVEIVRLVRNLGHQRAIAVGLVALLENQEPGVIIVMDADGEDKPEDIPRLLSAHEEQPDAIVVARRDRRSEDLLFHLFYWIYKLLFRLLTGEWIDFGNFSLIPSERLEDLTYDPNLWNHLAATVARSNIPVKRLKTDRGQRYVGETKMDFQSLVLHGLSALSVYLEIIAVRSLIALSAATFIPLVGIVVVLYLVSFTDLAIPGWATSATGLLSVLFLQALLFLVGAVFVILNRRSDVLITPALDTEKLIRSREVIHGD